MSAQVADNLLSGKYARLSNLWFLQPSTFRQAMLAATRGTIQKGFAAGKIGKASGVGLDASGDCFAGKRACEHYSTHVTPPILATQIRFQKPKQESRGGNVRQYFFSVGKASASAGALFFMSAEKEAPTGRRGFSSCLQLCEDGVASQNQNTDFFAVAD
jgi:hypothetical protein